MPSRDDETSTSETKKRLLSAKYDPSSIIDNQIKGLGSDPSQLLVFVCLFRFNFSFSLYA